MIQEVVRWLVDSSIPRDRLALNINRGWIHFNATAAQVEELLKTKYCFTHEDAGAQQISAKFPLTIIYPILFVFNHQCCQCYSIPARMKKHIDLIMPPFILITYPPQWSGASILADSALWNPGQVPIE